MSTFFQQTRGQEGKSIVGIIVAVLATLLVVGGIMGLAYGAKQKELKDAKSRIATLEKEVLDLQTGQTTTTNKTTTTDDDSAITETPAPDATDETTDTTTADGSSVYTSADKSYSFSYTDEFSVATGDHADYTIGTFLTAKTSAPEATATLRKTLFPKTNLKAAWASVSSSSTLTTAAACKKIYSSTTLAMPGTEEIGGVTWSKGVWTGAAAENTISSTVYHVFQDASCYEVSLNMATAPLTDAEKTAGNREVSSAEVFDKLKEILSSYSFEK